MSGKQLTLAPQKLVLPALWLNTVFGNQVWSATLTALGQLFYWISLLLAAAVVCLAFRKSMWPYLLVMVVVGSRVASLANVPGLREIYLFSMLVLFIATGVALSLLWPRVLETQARVFLALSLPLMFLQVAGVGEWLQVFNTLYLVDALAEPGEIVPRPEIRLLPLLLSPTAELIATRYGDFYEFLSMQARPPGLSHSSAMLALFILAGAAIHFARMRSPKITLNDLVLTACVVLCGAKVVLLGFVMLLTVVAVRCDKVLRGRVGRTFVAALLLLALYVLLFPAAANQNIGRDAFAASFLTRAIDAIIVFAPNIVYLPDVADVVSTYSDILADDRENAGSFSGLATLIRMLPLGAAVAFVGLPWLVRGFNYCRSVAPRSARMAEYMLLVVIIAPFATPIIGSQFYACCIGVAVMPIAAGMSRRMRARLESAAFWPTSLGQS